MPGSRYTQSYSQGLGAREPFAHKGNLADIGVNLGRQLGSNPSNNFAARLVRLMNPSLYFRRLKFFCQFLKFHLYISKNSAFP